MKRVWALWIRLATSLGFNAGGAATSDDDMHAELESHLRMATDENMRRGMAPDAARREALIAAGGLASAAESMRDTYRVAWLDSVAADVRFAFRQFARKPLASAMIVVILAFGIGGHALELTVLLQLTSRPPAGVSDDVPLVRLRGMVRAKDDPEWRKRALWSSEMRELAALPNTFAAVAAWTRVRAVANAAGALHDEAVFVNFVTEGYFRTLGIPPTHGPGLGPEGAAPQLSAVISDAMWEDAFDRAEVAGRVVKLNGVDVRIVGVAPPRFTGALPDQSRRIMWLPLSARAVVTRIEAPSAYASPDSATFDAVGLLRPGVSVEQATAAAHVVTARVAPRMVPPPPPTALTTYLYDADVVALRGDTDVHSHMGFLVPAWTALTALVLLVVCSNVSGLMIGSAVNRRQEIGVRLSLGASRARVIRQLLTESVLLALAGAALGLVVLWVGFAAAAKVPELINIRPDLEVAVFTILVAAGTGILFGLAPALHATKAGVADVLKSTGMGATRRSRMHQVFVVGQIVLTQPLLVLVASLIGLVMVSHPPELPAGIPAHVLRMPIEVRWTAGPDSAKYGAVRRLMQRISEVPGVVQVTPEPDRFYTGTIAVRDEDRGSNPRAAAPIKIDMKVSKPGYFALLGVPLLRGNDLPPTDTSSTVIIGSDLARALWGTADPIGRRFRQTSPSIPRDLIVTGVYDSQYLANDDNPPAVYRATQDWMGGASRYLIRTAGPAADLADTLRRIAREELPSTAIERPMTLAQEDERTAGEARMGQRAALGVAGLVLVVSSIGLYGIVALSVGQRRREIGVRMALGARAGQMIGLFYRSGLRLGALGLLLGLPISLLAARYLPALADGAGIQNARLPNPFIIGIVVATVVSVFASVATLIPAARAATVDPTTALRTE